MYRVIDADEKKLIVFVALVIRHEVFGEFAF